MDIVQEAVLVYPRDCTNDINLDFLIYLVSLFALSYFFNIIFIYPLFCKSAIAAYVTIYIDCGKNGTSDHDIISCSVWAAVTVYSDDIVRLAFGAGFGIFHNSIHSFIRF